MKIYKIAEKSFEFDDSKVYYDFYLSEGQRTIGVVQFEGILNSLQENKITLEDIKESMIYWDRWIKEAPRKKFYRGLKKQGTMVLSGEYWFENESDAEAEQIFVNLENTGNLARKFLEEFLPEEALRCKEEHHPAEKYYIDP